MNSPSVKISSSSPPSHTPHTKHHGRHQNESLCSEPSSVPNIEVFEFHLCFPVHPPPAARNSHKPCLGRPRNRRGAFPAARHLRRPPARRRRPRLRRPAHRPGRSGRRRQSLARHRGCHGGLCAPCPARPRSCAVQQLPPPPQPQPPRRRLPL